MPASQDIKQFNYYHLCLKFFSVVQSAWYPENNSSMQPCVENRHFFFYKWPAINTMFKKTIQNNVCFSRSLNTTILKTKPVTLQIVLKSDNTQKTLSGVHGNFSINWKETSKPELQHSHSTVVCCLPVWWLDVLWQREMNREQCFLVWPCQSMSQGLTTDQSHVLLTESIGISQRHLGIGLQESPNFSLPCCSRQVVELP